MGGRPVQIDMGESGSELLYVLPPGEALRPETVTAFVDGSGAAGSFVVRLTLYAQNGAILSQTRTDDSVAAGDSAEGTFAPF